MKYYDFLKYSENCFEFGWWWVLFRTLATALDFLSHWPIWSMTPWKQWICVTLHLLTFAPDAPQHPGETHTSHILSGSRGYRRATSLLITAVNQSDSGTYRCHADNERGASATALQLDVRGEFWRWLIDVCACMASIYRHTQRHQLDLTNIVWACLKTTITTPPSQYPQECSLFRTVTNTYYSVHTKSTLF